MYVFFRTDHIWLALAANVSRSLSVLSNSFMNSFVGKNDQLSIYRASLTSEMEEASQIKNKNGRLKMVAKDPLKTIDWESKTYSWRSDRPKYRQNGDLGEKGSLFPSCQIVFTNDRKARCNFFSLLSQIGSFLPCDDRAANSSPWGFIVFVLYIWIDWYTICQLIEYCCGIHLCIMWIGRL